MFLEKTMGAAIRAFRAIVHLLAGPQPSCRFEPSCSSYMRQAVQRFGIFRGGLLGLSRIGRCRPLSDFGWDPVPESEKERRHANG